MRIGFVDRVALNRWSVAATMVAVPLLAVSSGMTTVGIQMFLGAAVLSLVPLFSMRKANWKVAKKAAATTLFLVLAAGAAVSFAFHPSPEGILFGVFAVSALGMALSVASFTIDEIRRFVVQPLLLTTTVQFALIVVQTFTGSAFGATILRPTTTLLVTNGDVVRPQGMYLHVYIAAGVALLSLAIAIAIVVRCGRQNLWFMIGLAAASSSIAMTHSRAALLGFGVVIAIGSWLAIRRVGYLRSSMLVVVVAFGVSAVVTANGWAARFDDSLADDLDASSLGRVTLSRQAISLAMSSPLVGVGPGLYLETVKERGLLDEDFPYAVHNVPLLAAVELGIPTAVAAFLLAGIAGLQAFRAGLEVLLVYASIVPMSVLDIVFYDRVNGLLLLGVWGGVCAALCLRGNRSTDSIRFLPSAGSVS